jgi:hypothetical protein
MSLGVARQPFRDVVFVFENQVNMSVTGSFPNAIPQFIEHMPGAFVDHGVRCVKT